MKLGHIPFLKHIISLHHLAVIDSLAPEPCILELFFKVLVNLLGEIFQLALPG